MLSNLNQKFKSFTSEFHIKNIEDDRESPSFNIMKILKSKNIKFEYNDPFFKA